MTDLRATGVTASQVTFPDRSMPMPARPPLPPFREIYESHVELVFRTLRRVGVPPSSVEDVAQEVFVSVHRALATWEGRSTMRTWIYRIARNAGLNHNRATRRRPDGTPTERADESRAHEASPESAAETHEALAVLSVLLMKIDEPKREVLALIDLEGFSAPEVAELLEVPLNTVYSRLRLARAQFERLLEEGDAT